MTSLFFWNLFWSQAHVSPDDPSMSPSLEVLVLWLCSIWTSLSLSLSIHNNLSWPSIEWQNLYFFSQETGHPPSGQPQSLLKCLLSFDSHVVSLEEEEEDKKSREAWSNLFLTHGFHALDFTNWLSILCSFSFGRKKISLVVCLALHFSCLSNAWHDVL